MKFKNTIRPGTIIRWVSIKNILINQIICGEKIKLLDIGGFDGFISLKLIKIDKKINTTIVDVDKNGLTLAKKLGLKTLNESVYNLSIKNNSIDLILFLDILEHLKKPKTAIRELSKKLKKSGKIIITTPKEKGVVFPIISTDMNKKINLDWGHNKLGFNLKEIKKIIKDTGLEIEYLSSYFGPITKFFYYIFYISFISKLVPNNIKYLFYIVPLFDYFFNKNDLGDEHIIILKKRL